MPGGTFQAQELREFPDQSDGQPYCLFFSGKETCYQVRNARQHKYYTISAFLLILRLNSGFYIIAVSFKVALFDRNKWRHHSEIANEIKNHLLKLNFLE